MIENIDWYPIKDNLNKLCLALEFPLMSAMCCVAGVKNVGLSSLPQPSLKVSSVYDRPKDGNKPTIADYKKGLIAFYFEILRDYIKKVNNNDDTYFFLESVALHEYLHLVLKHTANTKEEKDSAEQEVADWINKNASRYETPFVIGMKIVEQIAENFELAAEGEK